MTELQDTKIKIHWWDLRGQRHKDFSGTLAEYIEKNYLKVTEIPNGFKVTFTQGCKNITLDSTFNRLTSTVLTAIKMKLVASGTKSTIEKWNVANEYWTPYATLDCVPELT